MLHILLVSGRNVGQRDWLFLSALESIHVSLMLESSLSIFYCCEYHILFSEHVGNVVMF
jgi:hypothetical protein